MLQPDGAPDSLFFYQLILPIHKIDPENGVELVENDPRQPYYWPVGKWSNLYTMRELDLGNGYGHKQL